MAQETAAPYPLSLRGELDPDLSRWLWLFKFFLIIPHIILLAFLWTAVIFVYVIAFFAILLNGRYPRSSSNSTWECSVGPGGWASTRPLRLEPTVIPRSHSARRTIQQTFRWNTRSGSAGGSC